MIEYVGQLGAVSVCVYTGQCSVIGRQPLSSSAGLVYGGWEGKQNPGQGIGWTTTAEQGLGQLSKHDDIGMQCPLTHATHFITNQSIPIIKMYNQQSTL